MSYRISEQDLDRLTAAVQSEASRFEHAPPEIKAAYAAGVRAMAGMIVALATQHEKDFAAIGGQHEVMARGVAKTVRLMVLMGDLIIPPGAEV